MVHLFAGANTARGFFSYYNYLASDSMRRVYILKGGPGTGKSTLLKNIAAAMQDRYSVEMYHCSADINSLDGIYIHDLDVSVLDGTAPHVTDPRLPGAVQQLVDLGACWNNTALIEQRVIIKEITDQIGLHYKLAYKWLNLAAGYNDLLQETKNNSDSADCDTKKIIALLPETAFGKTRRAFASAVTGNGLINYLPEIGENVKTKVCLIGGNRAYNTRVLCSIQKTLEERAIPATYLYCGLQPEYLEHLVIPGEFALFSVHGPHLIEAGLNSFGLESSRNPLEGQVLSTLDRAVSELAQAHTLHCELEKLYTPHVDFREVEKLQNKILAEIAHI